MNEIRIIFLSETIFFDSFILCALLLYTVNWLFFSAIGKWMRMLIRFEGPKTSNIFK